MCSKILKGKILYSALLKIKIYLIFSLRYSVLNSQDRTVFKNLTKIKIVKKGVLYCKIYYFTVHVLDGCRGQKVGLKNNTSFYRSPILLGSSILDCRVE